MEKFAFISRHEPTPEQHKLAADQGIELVPVGDRDAFIGELDLPEECVGVVVVHPAAAMRHAALGRKVGVFENAMRAVEGGKPTFEAKSLHVYGGDPAPGSREPQKLHWTEAETIAQSGRLHG